MKLTIAICDDDSNQRRYLAELTAAWAKSRQHAPAFCLYDSAEAFLFAYDADKNVDLLLLDIQMKDMNGVELARRLRMENRQIQIIFITGFADYMAEGFEVAALHYLLKPVDPAKLTAVLDRAAELLSRPPRSVLLETEDGTRRVAIDEIRVVEAQGHLTLISAECGRFAVKASIGELEKLLGDGFFRCQRSFLIGLAFVQKVTRKAVFMTDGTEIPLSRGLYEEINRAIIRYFP